MREDEGLKLHIIHRMIAVITLFGSGGATMFWIKPPGIEPFNIWITLVCAYIVMRLVISDHRQFTGYGIMSNINRIAGKKIGPEYALIGGIFFPKQLINLWMTYVGIAVANMIIVYTAPFWLEMNGIQQEMIAVLRYIAISVGLGLVAAIYVWIMADRKWRWYVSETVLRQVLAVYKFEAHESSRIITEARAQNLLLKPSFRH